MSEVCQALHDLVRERSVHRFPFEEAGIPENGIYVLFEEGEAAHDGERIVRIGTHTGDGQLRSRLKQHFIQENKDRSIFRKNIGRALLNRAGDPFLEHWNLDLTSRRNRERYGDVVDFEKQAAVEVEVSERIQSPFWFVVFEVPGKERRLELERKMIGTVSLCEECGPSAEWLGLASPKQKIQKSGLWQEQELWKEALAPEEIGMIRGL